MTTDPIPLAVVTGLHLLCAVGAIYLSRPHRAPFYRAFAWLFAGSLVTELVRWGNRAWVLQCLPRPLQGWHRVPGHVEQALVLAWPAAVVTVVWWAFRPRSSSRTHLLLPGLVYACLLSYLVTHYPEVRAERLDAFYRYVSQGEALTLVGISVVGFVRPPTWPLVGDRTAMLLIAAELARFGGALGWNHSPMKDADLDALVYGALYVAVAMVQGWDLWRRRVTGSPIAS
jgi:hypothetical protein